MKILKYNIATKVNCCEENAECMTVLSKVEMSWSEVNEEIAKQEAYNGEYTIDDDGLEESTEPTQEERITELEEALEMLLNGVTE